MADDLIRHFQDVIVVAAAERKGFHGMLLLTDHQARRALSVDLWATEADLAADERASYREPITKVSDLLVAAPLAEVYDVSVQVDLTAEGGAHIRGI
jgi:hypothetical protein